MPTAAADHLSSDDELARFVCTKQAGEIVFAQGEFGSELYIVEAGDVELLTMSSDGELLRRALLTVGETFGERALLDEQARDMTARAVTDCRLLRLDYGMLVELIREKPLIGVLLLRRQVRRVRWQTPAGDAPVTSPSVDSGEALPLVAPASVRPRFVHRETGQEFALPDGVGETIVGRVDRATGLAPPIDFTDIDPQRTLSRRHARVVRDGIVFQLHEEPGAANGTFVNDRRIPSGHAVALRDSDRVRFGFVETVFRCS